MPTLDSTGDTHISPPISFYQYAMLPSDSSFRVLELFRGKKNNPISYRMHIVDWSSPPHYEAISYAWGDVKDTTYSLCDGLILPLTESLKGGLAAMRYEDKSRWLWADAICIDQSNKEEREHQVSHMGIIYNQATKVIVWLGKDVDNQALKAMALIEEITQQCISHSVLKGKGDKAKLRNTDELWDLLPQQMISGIQHNNNHNWDALAWLFSRPWFNRLWVIQEVNSNPDVEVLCGRVEISWDKVALTAAYIDKHPKIHVSNGFPDSYYVNAYYMRRRLWFRDVTLPSFLNWGRSFRVTDPLDRVYGLMGMPPFTEMKRRLQVDYSKSTVDLYKRVAQQCIKDMESLRVLCYVHNMDQEESFPSWVPRWDREEGYRPINDSLTKVRWKASGDTKSDVRFNKDALILTGIVFDNIVSEFPFGNHMGSEDDVSTDYILQAWDMNNKHHIHHGADEAMDSFALALTAGLGSDLRKASEDMMGFRANFTAYLQPLLKKSGREPQVFHYLTSGPNLESSFKYETRMKRQGQNRSLFFTKGGYVGLGPSCQQGDVVCLLFGGEVPFILRPKGGCYQLVGDAYIHEIMEGESMQQLNMNSFNISITII